MLIDVEWGFNLDNENLAALIGQSIVVSVDPNQIVLLNSSNNRVYELTGEGFSYDGIGNVNGLHGDVITQVRAYTNDPSDGGNPDMPLYTVNLRVDADDAFAAFAEAGLGGGQPLYDLLTANWMHDIVGYNGSDQLTGGSREDMLSGEAGNDRLDGDGGHNVLYGGDSSDIFIIRNGYAFNTIGDFGYRRGRPYRRVAGDLVDG